jgi:hypothetical protein
MPDGFTSQATTDRPTIASGQSMVVTLHYEYRPIDPAEPAPEVFISCSPAFAIACQPSPVTLAPASHGIATVTVTIRRAAPAPPSFCQVLFNALHDHCECTVTVTP